MKEKSKQSNKEVPKELRMVNREYDEIIFEPDDLLNDSIRSSNKRPSNNSKNKQE
ncbi:MAG: hypothetical protein PHC92_08325 [Syntrophomonadaceae bacterium]|nr:hypothetical protein [Syntrophomonadaceae bacterium]